MHEKNTKPMTITMIALNQGQPFVSKRLAEKIALIVIEDRYPKDFFLASDSAVVVEKEDVWYVTFENVLIKDNDNSILPMINGSIVPRSLTITIGKENGEIIDIS